MCAAYTHGTCKVDHDASSPYCTNRTLHMWNLVSPGEVCPFSAVANTKSRCMCFGDAQSVYQSTGTLGQSTIRLPDDALRTCSAFITGGLLVVPSPYILLKTTPGV
jgi:hypothetical protein